MSAREITPEELKNSSTWCEEPEGMTPDEFSIHWRKVTKDVYLTDRVHQPRSLSALMEILSYLSRYTNGQFHAGHDVIYLGDSFWGTRVPEIPIPQLLRLARLGVHWDDKNACFATFCARPE